jgi:hypothetical protein
MVQDGTATAFVTLVTAIFSAEQAFAPAAGSKDRPHAMLLQSILWARTGRGPIEAFLTTQRRTSSDQRKFRQKRGQPAFNPAARLQSIFDQ